MNINLPIDFHDAVCYIYYNALRHMQTGVSVKKPTWEMCKKSFFVVGAGIAAGTAAGTAASANEKAGKKMHKQRKISKK